ncbi:LacI family DNA-binding transcriptional regulator [uncultured Cohaesibacter sp.]|uniref:LacI family DNA-binding transcriptional regulator n=1 Tax=uncultured Cohaesibacter sp. TaxID=1002546 RepID=UPI00292E0FE0|nr:LacI family DNA-binding transcriptional regulator [uncultured Cohaesibacter sp.]
MADIRKIAELAGVSTATVSRVVNSHPHVNSKTRDRVLKVIQDQNYYPNALAANLRRKTSDIIGYLQFGSPKLVDSRMAQIAESILFEAGFKTFMCNADEDPDREQFFLDEMIGRRVAGAILCPQGRDERALKAAIRLQQAGIATLLQSTSSTNPGVSSVAVNQAQGWQVGITHLMALGHKQITFLGHAPTNAERQQSILQPMTEMHIQHLWLRTDKPFKESIGLAIDQLLNTPSTALICASEQIAATAIQQLHKRQINVPKQISIMCFGGSDFSRMILPRITVISLPVEDLGLLCAQQMLNLISRPDAPARNILIENQLVIGDTTAHPQCQ